MLFVRNPSSHQAPPLRQTQQTTQLENRPNFRSKTVCAPEEGELTCFVRGTSSSASFQEMTSSYVLDKREIM